MIEPETLYTTPIEPDISDPRLVLAFLLVPDSVFLGPNDGPQERAAVHELMQEAKRDVLLGWYATTMRRGG